MSHFRFWILRGNKKRPGFKAGYLRSKYSFEPGFFLLEKGEGRVFEKGVDNVRNMMYVMCMIKH